jgi:hypothetical protein
MTRPRFWKLSLLSWICIYPLISIISLALLPHVANVHPLLRTLMVTVVLVPLMTMAMAVLQKRFHAWVIR